MTRLVILAVTLVGAVLAQQPPGQAKRVGQSLVRESRAHGGRFVEAETRGVRLGYVELPNGRLRWVRNGKPAELIPLEAPPEADPLPPVVVEGVAPVVADTAGQLDLLVFYTPQARTGAGGQAQIENTIALGVERTNLALRNSRLAWEARLLAALEVTWPGESGSLSTELSRFRGTTDGYGDEAHGLRNAYGADLMALIVNGGDYAGMGYMGPSTSSIYTVTARAYVVGNLSFAHELGHNLGLGHNVGSYSYCGDGVGYSDPGGKFRTVLSYGGAPRTPHFASPSILHYLLGLPTGTAQTNAAGCLAKTLPMVAAYRTANVNPPPAPPTAADAANVR